MKVRGMDPNGGVQTDDEVTKLIRPIGGSNVRPVQKTDGETTGDVLKRRPGFEQIDFDNVVSLLNKKKERRKKLSEIPSREFRSRVIAAYLKAQICKHDETLRALNFDQEA